jgi:alkylated DNA repair dioxygenase AlkB
MITHIVEEFNDAPSVFCYVPNFLKSNDEKDLYKYLENTNDFIPSYKYTHGISRLQKWYQVDKKYFCPMWKVKYPQWNSFEIDEIVENLIEKMQSFIDRINIPEISIPRINSCLINKYPRGENFIAPHRDSAQSFGEEPTIIGLSVGETRNIDFIRNDDPTKSFSFTLESGSVFIMGGSSQKYYVHTIKKSFCENPRYSLTFREFIL